MAKTFNGEHAKIYDRMEENHSELVDKFSSICVQLGRIETKLEFIKEKQDNRDKLCAKHWLAIDWNRTKILLAIGGLSIFSLIVSTKAIGLW